MINSYAQRAFYGDRIEISFTNSSGQFAIAQPLLFKESNEGDRHDPTISMRPSEAQSLMDALWFAGLRPTEGTGSAGSLAATERHLADMRAITMNFLDIKTEKLL